MIKKTINSEGEVRWDVRTYRNGRGSERVFRRFSRKSDAEAFLHDLKDKKQKSVLSPSLQVTFEGKYFHDEAAYWLQDGRLRFSASHLKRVEAVISEIQRKFGRLPVERLTPEFLSKLQQLEKAGGLQNASINRKTEVVTAILNHSVKHRRIPFSPANGFRKLGKTKKEMLFWEWSEAVSFLNSMNEKYPRGHGDRWVYVVYLLALNTGLRAGEIWGLTVSDLTQAGNVISIRKQQNRVTNSFSDPKGGKPRTVPCNGELSFELRQLVERNQLRSDQTFFRSATGSPVCHDNFADRRFKADMKHWGGRAIRFHDLRHTAATQMISGGVDLKTVKEICGHANIETTMNYAHLVRGVIERVSETFSIRPNDGKSGREDENQTSSLVER